MTQTMATLLVLQAAQVDLLREILAAVRQPAPVPDDDRALVGCEHPEDRRVDLSTPADRDHWVCGICRFDNKIRMQ